MNNQHILGTLTPSNPEAITSHTYRHIYKAVTENNLYGIVFAENWQEGIFTLDNHTPNVTANECSSPLEFIHRLTRFINAKGIAELGLEGAITVMVPHFDPVVFRLIVEDGKILQQQANIVWDETKHFF